MIGSPLLPRRRGPLTWVVLFLLVLCTLWPSAGSAQERSWREAALWTGAGTTLVAAVLLDQAIRAEFAAAAVGTDWSALSTVGTYGGRARYAFPVLGAVYVTGWLSDRDELATAAAHTAAALLAAGAVNGVLKVGLGRLRPGPAGQAGEFRPLSLDDQWQSFPSGHAVVAFSLAAAVSEQADRPWVSVVSYGTAAVVGWSRVYEDRHWASDVVGGAIVGIAASKVTVRWLNARSRGEVEGEGLQFTLLPAGLSVSIPIP